MAGGLLDLGLVDLSLLVHELETHLFQACVVHLLNIIIILRQRVGEKGFGTHSLQILHRWLPIHCVDLFLGLLIYYDFHCFPLVHRLEQLLQVNFRVPFAADERKKLLGTSQNKGEILGLRVRVIEVLLFSEWVEVEALEFTVFEVKET